MRTATPWSLALVAAVALGASSALAGAEPATKTPYERGTPPVTDGYTDTSQGGTKTSGDAPIPPPSRNGKVLSIPGTAERVPGTNDSPVPTPSDDD